MEPLREEKAGKTPMRATPQQEVPGKADEEDLTRQPLEGSADIISKFIEILVFYNTLYIGAPHSYRLRPGLLAL